ncbi:hypothetical protein GCM10009616_15280 [Microlunatus lacustris]
MHPDQPGLGNHAANAASVVDEAEQFDLVVATNARAIRLCTSLEFAVLGRVPGAFHWRREAYVDALVLHRSLLPAVPMTGPEG